MHEYALDLVVTSDTFIFQQNLMNKTGSGSANYSGFAERLDLHLSCQIFFFLDFQLVILSKWVCPSQNLGMLNIK